MEPGTAADDERREVARRLRELPDDSTYPDPIGAVADHEGRYAAADAADRPADPIEPTGGPTERGADSIHDRCFARIGGADGAEDYVLCSIVSAIEEYRHPERVAAGTVRPVDRDALLALADGTEESGNLPVKHPGVCVLHDDDFSRELGHARRIREACGETGRDTRRSGQEEEE